MELNEGLFFSHSEDPQRRFYVNGLPKCAFSDRENCLVNKRKRANTKKRKEISKESLARFRLFHQKAKKKNSNFESFLIA